MLKEGDKAPSFNMPTNTGEKVILSKLKGKKVVLYFYPRDDTSGLPKKLVDSEMILQNTKKPEPL